ncbi:HotDog domain-containing protein [Thelonectria olida]|uniref:HotDog domain-containing protein n=1 Tax=Thelonectria olida TaxID=1576542 RepID=A0A9P8W6I5_9HYPO|nr:HotDog domain-containing protein [Thelonectria olida]
MSVLSKHNPALGRQCCLVARRAYTAPPSAPTSILAAINAIKAHPPKVIPDYLSPTPSHLLTTTISDLVGASSSSSPVVSSPPRALPQGHHLVYFPIQLPPSRLVPDGADPDHSPGAPFSRRVWAGGEVTFRRGGLVLDCRPVVCRETIEEVSLRGKGPDEKVFVDVWRRYGLGHGREERNEWQIEERRTLVFMKEQETSPPSSSTLRLIKYPHPASHSISLTPSPTHLFHFSALSFNAHAIHFDPLYARAVDGHRALLVHGPFTLALMLRVLTDHLGADLAVQRFTYRNHAPLYVNERMAISLRKVSSGAGEKEGEERWDVWVEGLGGGLAVKGTAVVAAKEESKSP